MASSITLPDFDFPANEDEDYDGDDFEDAEGEEYDEAEDLDAEAEAMARRLGDQLLADIAKAQAEAAAAAAAAASPHAPQVVETPENPHPPVQETGIQPTSLQKKREAALLTMRGILAFASKHAIVGSTMSVSQIPGEGGTLVDVFNRCVSSSTISKPLARALTEAVLSLAKSDALFGSLRNSDAPAIQLDKGKRKRDETDEGGRYPAHYPQKRIAVPLPVDQPDLLGQIGEALRVTTHALTASAPSSSHSINPSVISPIQLQLHQIFLFAVTSAPRAGDGRMQALQELAGLVQMLGVLSGIHIGNPPPHPGWHVPPGSAPPPPPDIGTAVYPCLVPGCPKTFHRLYSLRTHQRLHTLEHRPYRCVQCPASFVRNHDLKRHTLLHEKKAWRCAGCNKIFSRRDAIKRHKDARSRAAEGKGRSGEAEAVDTACAYAEIEEVEVDKVDGEEDISRRAKLWNGIAASSAGATMAEHMGPEEGEVDPAMIHQAQHMVLGIHGLLQAEVSKGLGAPTAPAPMPPPQDGQSTLASIIARAQQSAAPPEAIAIPDPPPTAERAGELSTAVDTSAPAADPVVPAVEANSTSTPPPLSLSWLSEEQTKLLEQAIAQAAAAAQAQAEAEAALEEEEEDGDEDEVQEGIEE